MKDPLSRLEKKYRSPERYRLIPNAKIIQPFGLDMTQDQLVFNRGIYFCKQGYLLMELYSPIEADWWKFDYRQRILYMKDTEFGIELKVFGIRTLNLSRRENTRINRGDPIGTAFQIEALKPLVYVEGIITDKSLQDSFRGRFLASEKESEVEKAYVKSWNEINQQNLRESLKMKTQYKYKNRISELTPYWLTLRSYYSKPEEFYFNYSALFY